MRDRRRVEAIGIFTEVFEEVIVIEELKWIFFGIVSMWKGVEAAIGRKRKVLRKKFGDIHLKEISLFTFKFPFKLDFYC